MCLAIPMQLKIRRETEGVAELNHVRRSVSLMLVPEAEAGDWLLVHAGYAIGCMDAEEARRMQQDLNLAAGLNQNDQ